MLEQLTHITDMGPACGDCDAFADGEGLFGFVRLGRGLWLARCGACGYFERFHAPEEADAVGDLRRAWTRHRDRGCGGESALLDAALS